MPYQHKRGGFSYFSWRRRALSFNEGGYGLNFHINWQTNRAFVYFGVWFSPKVAWQWYR